MAALTEFEATRKVLNGEWTPEDLLRAIPDPDQIAIAPPNRPPTSSSTWAEVEDNADGPPFYDLFMAHKVDKDQWVAISAAVNKRYAEEVAAGGPAFND